MKTRNLNLILTSRLRAVTIYALRRIEIPKSANFREGKDLKRPDCYVMSHQASHEFCIMCNHSFARTRLAPDSQKDRGGSARGQHYFSTPLGGGAPTLWGMTRCRAPDGGCDIKVYLHFCCRSSQSDMRIFRNPLRSDSRPRLSLGLPLRLRWRWRSGREGRRRRAGRYNTPPILRYLRS